MWYVISRDRSGEWRWVLKANNGEPLAVSSEGYTTKYNCQRCIDLVKGSASAVVIDV
jgi:uncharacterized protein